MMVVVSLVLFVMYCTNRRDDDQVHYLTTTRLQLWLNVDIRTVRVVVRQWPLRVQSL